MRLLLLMVLAATSVAAQSNVRGTVAGTNDYAVTPLRSAPKVAWEIKPRYRDVSALVVSGSVLVTGNTSGQGGTFAYDTATGKQLWSVPGHMRGHPAADATAAYAVNDTRKANRYRLSKLDLRTGKPLWSAEEEDLGNHDAAPVITGAQVVLTTRSRSITAFDSASGKLLWRHDKTTPCAPTLSVSDGRIYFSGGLAGTADNLTALNAATGEKVWSAALSESDGSKGCGTLSTAVAGGMVFTGMGRDLFALDAATGAVTWRRDVAPTVNGRKQPMALGQLVVTGAVIYTASASDLVGFDLKSGKPVFQMALPAPSDVGKIVLMAAGGVMFVQAVGQPANSSMVHAIDLASKQVLWSHATGRPNQYDPTGRWATRFLLPVDNGLYYENEQLIVKLVAP
jgi:outer membrane protein assembly factor BamB